jgi:hypothetical protein
MVHPEADAIAPLQSSRHLGPALFTIKDEHGKNLDKVNLETMLPDLRPIDSAHFGLTLINAHKLKELPRPWFMPVHDADGRWEEGRIDEDINFWIKWKAAGNTLFLANRIAIGHLELAVRWPGKDLQTILQPVREWKETRLAPAEAWT